MAYNNVDFAAELKEIRERNGITLLQVAKALNTHTTQIKRIEAGQNITVNTLAEYLEVVGLDLLDIFRE